MLRLLSPAYRLPLTAGMFALALMWLAQSLEPRLRAQEGGPSSETADAAAPEATPPADDASTVAPADDDSLSLLRLYWNGGIFMIPITLLSVIAVIAGIERGIALRRGKVVPEGLITALGQLSTSPGGFDPRKAFRICQQYPSAASNVVRMMLLRVGRPVAEVETAVKEASDREATRLYFNCRWLNLTATVGTLFGLLGTIQGMILAFHRMTTLPPGADKALELSSGIYVALVTTFAGLCVAIPSVMLAHFFEGRIQSMFMDIEELVQSLLPQIERYEGKVRFGRAQGEEASEPAVSSVS